jgi:RHS repeat-associated protein
LLNTQGQFAERDNESNETFFELRNYDPLLGRFNTIDPYGQYFSPYLAMGNSHPNMIDPDGGYSASNPFLGTGGFGSGGASGMQILGSVSGVLSAAMMGNAFAFQNAVGELNASVTYTETPKSNNWWGNFWNKPIGIKAGEFKTQKEYEDFKQSNKGDETAAEAAEWAGALIPFGGGIKITFSLKGIFKSIAKLFSWKSAGTLISKNSIIEGFKVSNHAWRKSGLGRGVTEELVSQVIIGARKAGTIAVEAGTGKFYGNVINIFSHNGIKVVIDMNRKIIMSIRPTKGFKLPK